MKTQPISTPAAILWASAFLLGGMIILKAGDLPGSTAFATSSNTGTSGVSLTTASSGLGPDARPYELLYVLDNRAEMMFVYEIEDVNQKRIVLRDGGPLPSLFHTGRGR